MIIARVFFEHNIPDELTEAATIDGANDVIIFFRIALPLSKAILAVLALQYAVGMWNEFFRALIYLPDSKLHPLAMFMRRLLITNTAAAANSDLGSAFMDEMEQLANVQQFKYASIIITVFPIICVYPLLQRYFMKGVLVGAVKG
jgi:ABC-type glycerol-3-phosphate transport system permease component